MTILGPRDFNNTNVTGTGAGAPRAISGSYTRAMHIRRRTAISIFNSVITGYGSASGPAVQGLEMDDDGTLANYTAGVGGFGNNVLLFPHESAPVYGTNVATGTPLVTIQGFWETGNSVGSASTVSKPGGALANSWSVAGGTQPAGAINPYADLGIDAGLFYGSKSTSTYPSNPNFAVTAGSITGQTAATLYASTKLGDFFDKTPTYKGAFGATDWTDGWSEFQPLTKAY